jgi:hypothetical protein
MVQASRGRLTGVMASVTRGEPDHRVTRAPHSPDGERHTRDDDRYVTRASHRRSRLASRSGRPITASRERLASVAASVRSGRPNTGITRASHGVWRASDPASPEARPRCKRQECRLTEVMASVTRGKTDHGRHAGASHSRHGERYARKHRPLPSRRASQQASRGRRLECHACNTHRGVTRGRHADVTPRFSGAGTGLGRHAARHARRRSSRTSCHQFSGSPSSRPSRR